MKLIIVESPHKAKTISKYLGSGYRVVASKGHVSDLPQKTMGIDVKNNFKPEYVVSPDKQPVIDMIKKEISQCDTVYLAADPDREGEAISWHLANVCGITDKNVRIVFNEISKKAVQAALQNPREINMGLVDAQQARRVLDRLMGYELSPIISHQVKGGRSAGRVQSVALKMVVDREREIRDFKPQEYWTINAFLVKDKKNSSLKCEFVDIGGKKCKVENKQTADSVIEGSKAGKWIVDNVKRAKSFSKPAPPFTTSTMQQDAISKLGMSASMVTQIAQRLYEGVEIPGEGQVALVTYIRSDSVRVSEEAQREALAFISENYGKDYCPKRPNVYATGAGAQDAHEAIRPITLAHTPESLKDKLARNDYRLYKLIYDRFVASQMANAEYDTLTVHIVSQSDKNYGYTLKGKVCTFKGFTSAYQSGDKEESSKELPNLNEGEELALKEIKGEQKFTKPPQRFTDGSFIKAMEENGIGRPSTFEKTITVLYKRTYIEKDGKFMKPTELGELVCDQLVKEFPDIMDTQFTAHMENNLDKIEEGNIKWYDVISDFYGDFHSKVLEVKYHGNKVKPKDEVTEIICEKCGANMVIKDSKYGKFLACPNFPKCRNTKPLGEAVAKCQLCKGDVVKKISKKGATFFSCNNYPECKFISWDLPAPYLCPECNNTMKIVASHGATRYVCTNKDCKHSENAPEQNKQGNDKENG
ncbi:MAG: type I DNA topoisomerase [Clostridia bacterium]|nr:type I DNA topoisomerase [Clostridia bacterium]